MRTVNRKVVIGAGLAGVACLALVLVLSYATRPSRSEEQHGSATRPGRLKVSQTSSGRQRDARSKARRYPTSALETESSDPKALAEPASDRDAIPDEYVLSFYDDAARDAFMALARAQGIEILDRMELGHAVRVRTGSRAQLERVLSESPPPMQWSHNFFTRVPSFPGLERERPDGPYVAFGGKSLQWLGVPRDNAQWGNGITVAVLDTGVSRHPSLADKRIPAIALVPESEEGQYTGHGTAVASLIAGTGSVPGIAPAADVLSVAVMGEDGTGDTFTLARGIAAAVDEGARVLNLSLGSRGDSFILGQAVQYALENGAVIVAATGNDAVNAVTFPAAYEGVVAVTAVDGEGRHVYFANRGPEVDIAAPGVAIRAAAPGGEVGHFSGTSAAAPLVSGAIAGLLSRNRGMTAREAADILLANGNDMGAPGPDPVYGRGVLDMGRVENRDTAGIYDIALGPPHVPTDTETPALVLYVQNRGTEPLPAVDMPVEIDGVPSTAHFYNIGVGETVSRRYYLDPTQVSSEGVRLTYSAEIDGPDDALPGNNARKQVRVGFTPTP